MREPQRLDEPVIRDIKLWDLSLIPISLQISLNGIN